MKESISGQKPASLRAFVYKEALLSASLLGLVCHGRPPLEHFSLGLLPDNNNLRAAASNRPLTSPSAGRGESSPLDYWRPIRSLRRGRISALVKEFG